VGDYRQPCNLCCRKTAS